MEYEPKVVIVDEFPDSLIRSGVRSIKIERVDTGVLEVVIKVCMKLGKEIAVMVKSDEVASYLSKILGIGIEKRSITYRFSDGDAIFIVTTCMSDAKKSQENICVYSVEYR